MLDDDELLRLADKIILAGASITEAGNVLKARCEKEIDSDPQKRQAKLMSMDDEPWRRYKESKARDQK